VLSCESVPVIHGVRRHIFDNASAFHLEPLRRRKGPSDGDDCLEASQPVQESGGFGVVTIQRGSWRTFQEGAIKRKVEEP
jgi:hypothetical protein